MQAKQASISKPWYSEPWPWLLMAGPATVIVAGVYTTVLAFSSADGLVADDYYKQGLAINRTLEREDRARALGLSAGVAYSAESSQVRVILRGGDAGPGPLLLRLDHPTRAGLDVKVDLTALPGGVYEGRASLPAGVGRWNASLETARWRMAGSWPDPVGGVLVLGAVRP